MGCHDGYHFLDGLSQEGLERKFNESSLAVENHMGIMLACMRRFSDSSDAARILMDDASEILQEAFQYK